jgi:hypothetical protein
LFEQVESEALVDLSGGGSYPDYEAVISSPLVRVGGSAAFDGTTAVITWYSAEFAGLKPNCVSLGYNNISSRPDELQFVLFPGQRVVGNHVTPVTRVGCGYVGSVDVLERPRTCFLDYPPLSLAEAVTLHRATWRNWGRLVATGRALTRVKTYDPWTHVRMRASGRRTCTDADGVPYSAYTRRLSRGS